MGGECEGSTFRKVEVLAGSCVVAGQLLDAIREQVEQDAKAAAEKAILERRAGGGAAGSSGGAAAAAAAKAGGGDAASNGGKKGTQQLDDSEDDDWSRGGGKKGGKKGKGAGGGGKGAKGGAGKGKAGGGGAAAGGSADGGDPALSVQRLVEKVVEMHPDMEGAGGLDEWIYGWGGWVKAFVQYSSLLLVIHVSLPAHCNFNPPPLSNPQLHQQPHPPPPPPKSTNPKGMGDPDLPAAVAALLQPSAVAAYQSTLVAAFTAGAESRRRAKDGAFKALEEAFVRLQLYGHGCEGVQVRAGALGWGCLPWWWGMLDVA